MTIETKFNVTDKVFVMIGNKVSIREIIVLDIWINANDIKIVYKIRPLHDGENCVFDESQCFATKQELLNSL